MNAKTAKLREERKGPRAPFDASQASGASERCIVPEHIEHVAHAVIGAAIEVHRHLGPGLPESIYEQALSIELNSGAIEHRCQAPVAITYKDQPLGEGRIDVLVEGVLPVELKAVEGLTPVHTAQVITYLKAMGAPLGLLINFNVTMLKDGLQRVIKKPT